MFFGSKLGRRQLGTFLLGTLVDGAAPTVGYHHLYEPLSGYTTISVTRGHEPVSITRGVVDLTQVGTSGVPEIYHTSGRVIWPETL